jgi:hypothetical protein
VVFEDDVTFEYAKLHEPLEMSGIEFKEDVNFEDTRYEGGDFTKYLIKKGLR